MACSIAAFLGTVLLLGILVETVTGYVILKRRVKKCAVRAKLRNSMDTFGCFGVILSLLICFIFVLFVMNDLMIFDLKFQSFTEIMESINIQIFTTVLFLTSLIIQILQP
ncbi:MAG: hypothetical protein ACI4J6_12115, partial [Oscillospiraceae bacterium]